MSVYRTIGPLVHFSVTWATFKVILTLEFVCMRVVLPRIWCYNNVYRKKLDLLSVPVAMVALGTHTS